MINEKLNNLVCRYQNTGDETVFNEIYYIVSRNWFSNPEGDARFALTDVSEVCAMYDDTLLRVVRAYKKKGNFVHMLRASIYNAKCDLREKNQRRRKMEIYEGDELLDQGVGDLLEVIGGEKSAEECALSCVQRERDQWPLISSLVAHSDDFTKKVVELLPSYDFSFSALGRALGVHHSKVSRALTRLSRNYDQERFGEISDYMSA